MFARRSFSSLLANEPLRQRLLSINGRYAERNRWAMGSGMVMVGLVLVGVAIVLGG